MDELLFWELIESSWNNFLEVSNLRRLAIIKPTPFMLVTLSKSLNEDVIPILLKKLEIKDEFVQDMFSIAFSGVKKSSLIIKNLDELNDNGEYANEVCDIHYILDGCLQELKPSIKVPIEINKNFTNNKYEVRGSQKRLFRALFNILMNATQSIQQKGVITIKTLLEEKSLIVKIIDNGKGIKKEDIGKAVNPFYTTRDPGEGVGMGLSIAYTIIKGHKGSLQIDSEEGLGTEVIVKIPLVYYSEEVNEFKLFFSQGHSTTEE